MDNVSMSKEKLLELFNQLDLTELMSLFTKIHTLINTDFSLTYLRIVLNGIKVLNSGETRASPGDNAIKSCLTELTELCTKQSQQDDIHIFMEEDTFLKCLKIIVYGLNGHLSDDWQPQGHTVEDYISQIIQGLDSPDAELQSCICVLFSFFVLIPNREHGIQRLTNAGVVHRLIHLIGTNDVSRIKPALLLWSLLLTGNIAQRNVLLQSGFVSHLNYLVKHPDNNVVHGAIVAVGNIARAEDNIHALLNTDILPEVIKHLEDTDKGIKLEAARVITNVLNYGTKEQIIFLCQQNILRPYFDLLTVTDGILLFRILDGLRKMLLLARELDQEDRLMYMIEECDGWKKLMKPQNNTDPRIRENWANFINEFLQHDWLARWAFQ